VQCLARQRCIALIAQLSLRCWFIHALRCSDTGARDADIVIVSSQLVTSGIYKMIKRVGAHAHRFTFQEFAALFAACSVDSQGLTSGNASRHLCASLLDSSDYVISDATSHVALTFKAVEHLRSVLQLRCRSAMRIIAACISSSAKSASTLRQNVSEIPKSPAAVDIVSDTTDACRMIAAAAAAAVAVHNEESSSTGIASSNQVKRQLAFADFDPVPSLSMQNVSAASSALEDCFNDDGSPIVTSQIDIRNQEQVLHNQQEDELQLQLQQLNQDLLQKQQRQQHSPHPPSKTPPSFKPARPSSPSAAISISPSLGQGSARSASPVPPAASALRTSSSPTFPAFRHPQERKTSDQSFGQRHATQQKQQPQISANHQALIDEAVQAARLQVAACSSLHHVP
jgi:hypothetical protein